MAIEEQPVAWIDVRSITYVAGLMSGNIEAATVKPSDRSRQNVDPRSPRDSASTISVVALAPLRFRLALAGVDCEAFFRSFGVELHLLADADARIPTYALSGIWEAAAEAAKDPWFGLHAAALVKEDTFGTLSYLAVCSGTLGEALRRVSRFFRLLTNAGGYELAVAGEVAAFRFAPSDPAWAASRQLIEFSIAVPYYYAQQHVARPWTAHEISFPHPEPDDTREYVRVFGAPVYFGAGAGTLTFAAELLDAPLKRGEPALAEILERTAAETIDRMPVSTEIARLVREQVIKLLPDGDLSIERIAERLAMTSRTLQRHLRREGTTWRELADDVRRTLATELLRQRDRSIAEIGFVLGYSEPAAFHRAFRRWTGSTPAAWRQRSEP